MTINKFGNLGIVGNVNTGGIININSMACSTTPTTGALTVAGGIGVVGNLNIGGLTYHGYDTSFNGNTQILSQTASTSITTGALRVAGGVGILGNLNIGGFSKFTFDSTFNGNILLTQTNNPLLLVANCASTINSTLATNANDVGIFYGTTNPASAGLVISPRVKEVQDLKKENRELNIQSIMKTVQEQQTQINSLQEQINLLLL